MERELDPTMVVEDEAAGAWIPLDPQPLFSATRAETAADGQAGDAGAEPASAGDEPS